MDLKGRIFLVTGATGGLGRTVVQSFRDAGAEVVPVVRRPDVPPGDEAVTADLTDPRSAEAAVARALERHGRLDGLVNLVGGYAGGTLAETSPDTWQRLLALNLTSAFLISRAVLPHLLQRKSGRVLHVGAHAARQPFAGAAAYITAKTGLLGLVRALAAETRGTGVNVNVVLPTIIDTPANRRDMPDADRSRWVPPGDLARILVFLASDAGARIHGQEVTVG